MDGGGPGGRTPSGRSSSQPSISVPFQSRQKSKNQREHGILMPPDVGSGAVTDVVTGINSTAPDDDVLLDAEVPDGKVGAGVIVMVAPSGSVVTIGVVIPVGSVMTPSLFEMTVSPAESVVVSSVIPGVIVVETPSGSVVTMGVDIPVGKVITPSLFDVTVWPAEFVVVRATRVVLEEVLSEPAPDGTNVRVSPSVVIVVALERPVGKVTTTPLSETTV